MLELWFIMKKIHYLSGITITVFIGLHLFNHIYGVFGPERHINLMNSFRIFYRNPIAETVLLLAVATQIFSGLRLFADRRKTAATAFEKLQIWSGLYLAFFLVIHVSAVLGGRFVLQLDTNIYFGSIGMVTFPFNLFFIPYYALAILSFFGHIASIHQQKMSRTVLGISPTLQSKMLLVFGLLVAFFTFFGVTNGFQPFPFPEEYNVLIGK